MPRLPVELHKPILQYVIGDDHKATTVACALTCHDWLCECGPHLFKSIVLDSPAHMDELLTHLTSPCSHITRYARTLLIIQRDEDPPWGHNVPHKLALKLPRIQEIRFSIPYQHMRSMDVQQDMTFSPNPVMPKIMGPLFARFKMLGTLQLDSYRFPSFTDLLRLAGEIPTLRHLRLEDVAWTHQPRFPPSLTRSGHRLASFGTSTGCKSLWPMPWLWCAPSRAQLRILDRTSFPGIQESDAGILAEICRMSNSRVMNAESPNLMTHAADFQCKLVHSTTTWILRVLGEAQSVMIQIEACSEQSMEMFLSSQPVRRDSYSSRPSSPWHILKVTFVSPTISALETTFYWAKVDKLLVQLPHLKEVILDTNRPRGALGDLPTARLMSIMPNIWDRLRIEEHSASIAWTSAVPITSASSRVVSTHDAI